MRIAYDNDYFAMEDVVGREIRGGEYWCSMCQTWHPLWKPENLSENVWAKLLSLTQKRQSSDWYRLNLNSLRYINSEPFADGVVILDTESQT